MMRLPLVMLMAVTATFTSWLGFEVAVPEGWSAYQMGETVSIRRLEDGPLEGFFVRVCPSERVESCLMEPGLKGELLRKEPAKLGPFAGTTYTYHRQTSGEARLWIELVTLATVKGKTYALDARIPTPEVEPEYRRLYEGIRESFRLVRP